MPVPESLRPLLRDVVGSAIVVAVVLGGLWAYSGMWPPMVVIESGSMQHSHTDSSVGIIDTGDLTLVQSSDRVDRIVTWAEGKRTGHRSYGGYGDVIVFHKNGLDEYTPVIHRAIVWIELNATTGDTFDVPELGQYDTLQIILRGLSTYHTGEEQVVDLPVNLRVVIDNFKGVGQAHGGYLTKGDNNPNVDQISLFWEVQPPGTTPRAEPVKSEWVVGVSRGELPWFGILKLWFGGSGNAVPENSWHDLLITVALLITVPVLIDLLVPLVAAALPRAARDGEARPAGLLGRLSRRRPVDATRPSAGPPAPGQPPSPSAIVYRTAAGPSSPPTSYSPSSSSIPSSPLSSPVVEWEPEPTQTVPVPVAHGPRPGPGSPGPRPSDAPVVYRYVEPGAPAVQYRQTSPARPPHPAQPPRAPPPAPQRPVMYRPTVGAPDRAHLNNRRRQ